MRADLHVHTYFSDGLLSPEDVVKSAKENGVELISITDHDAFLADIKGIECVNGIEVSAYINGVKLHTLGYAFNPEKEVFKNFTSELLKGSEERLDDILNKLNDNHVRLEKSEVYAEKFSLNSPTHAMHIARAGAKKGYADNPFTFYAKYLAGGKCAFSDIARPSPQDTIRVINLSGGFCSLAHPGRIELEREEKAGLIARLKDAGLRGIEAVYSAHTNVETEYYKEMAGKLNLVVTGGSDTHYTGGKRRIGTPEFHIDDTLSLLLKI